jgi:purine nucleosidase
MDDQWALAHLALSREFEVRGVVTTHAPNLKAPAAETSAAAARDVLTHLPVKTRPPVIAGSSVPLADAARPLPNPGVEFILRESRGFSRERRLPVLVIGAATDAASALLTDASLGNRIEIIAMGFNRWPEGTDPWNVKNDPKAWQALLRSRAPIVVGDADVTRRDLRMDRAQAKALFEARGAPGRYLSGLFTRWLDEHAELCKNETGNANAWPVWDQVTVAYLMGLTRQDVHPRPDMGEDMKFIHPPAGERGRTITWITRIDADRLWCDFTGKLDAAMKAR